MKQVQIYMEEEMHQRLREAAFYTKKSQSQLTREALIKYLPKGYGTTKHFAPNRGAKRTDSKKH